jgi:CRP-like cAMP-binding protein
MCFFKRLKSNLVFFAIVSAVQLVRKALCFNNTKRIHFTIKVHLGSAACILLLNCSSIAMFDKLQAKIQLTPADVKLMKELFIPRHLNKGEFLQRAGEVSQYGAFVASGCLRSYIIDDKGKEHIIQFAPENWWMSDITSAAQKIPSLYFIEAIEPTDLLMTDLPSYQLLLQQIPEIARSYQIGLQNQAAAKNQRIAASLSASAEERYVDFMKMYPSLALRVPQHMIASYLGITPETLSRVRKQLMKK